MSQDLMPIRADKTLVVSKSIFIQGMVLMVLRVPEPHSVSLVAAFLQIKSQGGGKHVDIS